MTIKFLKVKCGDSILINFKDDKGVSRNLVIDTGHHRKNIYPNFFQEVEKIIERNEKIDLLVLTHRDDDHIGGIWKLLNNKDFNFLSYIEEVWLNHSLKLSSASSKISIGKAVDLKELLQASKKCPTDPVTTEMSSHEFYGARLIILSPDKKSYDKEVKNFEKEEKNRKISKRVSDHNKSIATIETIMTDFKEDTSISNGSSIALLLEYKNKKGLLLADAHPSVIIKTLKQLGYSKDNKIKTDFLKVSHHGGKFNTSLELLSTIDCQHFIFSTNGKNGYNLPNKETIVRIIKNPERSIGKKIYIYFTEHDKVLEEIFKIDNNPFEESNFEIIFQRENELLTFSF